jgi:hypothetical protein
VEASSLHDVGEHHGPHLTSQIRFTLPQVTPSDPELVSEKLDWSYGENPEWDKKLSDALALLSAEFYWRLTRIQELFTSAFWGALPAEEPADLDDDELLERIEVVRLMERRSVWIEVESGPRQSGVLMEVARIEVSGLTVRIRNGEVKLDGQWLK